MDKLFFYTDAHDNSCKMKESQEKFGFRRAAHLSLCSDSCFHTRLCVFMTYSCPLHPRLYGENCNPLTPVQTLT